MRRPKKADVLDVACRLLKFDPNTTWRSRNHEALRKRGLVAYALHMLCEMSYPEISSMAGIRKSSANDAAHVLICEMDRVDLRVWLDTIRTLADLPRVR